MIKTHLKALVYMLSWFSHNVMDVVNAVICYFGDDFSRYK